MGFFRDPRVLWTLAALVLAAFLLPSLLSANTWLLIILLGVGALGFFGVTWLLKHKPSFKRRPKLVAIDLLPPPERYRGRSPTTLEALAQALSGARLGMVAIESNALRLQTHRGDLVEVTVMNPERITLDEVRVRTTSTEQALFACDALAPLLGPFTFSASEAELFVDGTTPREDLARDLLDQFLRGAKRGDSAASSPRRYLN